MRISLLVNRHRPDAVASAKEVANWLVSQRVLVGIEPEFASEFGLPADCLEESEGIDYVLSFGGDGTLIRAAHACCQKGIPILGVYYGRFGFVTQVNREEIGAALSMLMEGKAPIEERLMLQTDLLRNGESVASMHSLNETALQRSSSSGLMVFDVQIDGIHIASYPADGILVATPTGSTAYNLSAGGPIVDPKLRAMLLTALAPHTLSARTLVLRPESEIILRIQTEGDAVLTIDGHTRMHLISGDQVRIRVSTLVTKLVSVEHDDFLEKLSNRLFYGMNATYGRKP